MTNDACEETIINKKKVKKGKKRLVSRQRAESLANIFKALSDPTRVKIFNALFDQELCVCDLAEVIELSQSATSHQLRFLRKMNLVKYQKEGKMVYYSLTDQHVKTIYDIALKHIKHGKRKPETPTKKH